MIGPPINHVLWKLIIVILIQLLIQVDLLCRSSIHPPWMPIPLQRNFQATITISLTQIAPTFQASTCVSLIQLSSIVAHTALPEGQLNDDMGRDRVCRHKEYRREAYGIDFLFVQCFLLSSLNRHFPSKKFNTESPQSTHSPLEMDFSYSSPVS